MDNNAEIKALRDRFNNKKSQAKEQFQFKDFDEFALWYEAQGEKCHYCGTTQAQLTALFQSGKIESKKPSFTATLHIERLDSKKGYTKENCRLACALCNNAKSDMINEANFRHFLPSLWATSSTP